MKHQRIWLAAASVVAIAIVGIVAVRTVRGSKPVYRQAAIERGDIESTISATGKLDAVTTVQVGTQVSGQVLAIYADFNDRVKKGQLIARIDPTLQQQAVREAEAGLQRSVAERVKAESDFNRANTLFKADVISAADLSASTYALAVGRANASSGEVALERARRNLAYTSIHAPIDGIVIERNVDVGQTVAASLSAPQIFLIANDLTRMQILAAVDESDVALIRDSMAVRFTVQAEARESFTGTVEKVRLRSTTTENVVSYTVVIGVDNTRGKLLPGMTATVQFLTGSAAGVLLVPNAALRITPTAEMLAEVKPAAGAASATDTSAAANATPTRTGRRGAGGGGARAAGARRSTGPALLWYIGTDGKLANTRVRTGMSDGQRTEVSGPGLREGMQIIVRAASAPAATAGGAKAASSPFQQQQPAGGRSGPPGGGF